MQVYGADTNGIEGCLVSFSVTKHAGRTGATLLGLAQKTVKEGLARVSDAIATLDGDWDVSSGGYVVDLRPAEKPKNSSGLELPLAIMLLQASLLQSKESLEAEISKLEQRLHKTEGNAKQKELRTRMVARIKQINNEKMKIAKYRKRIVKNKNKYLLIGSLDISDGSVVPPEHGMLGMISCAEPGFHLIVPEAAEVQASLVTKSIPNVVSYKVKDLQETLNVVLGLQPGRRTRFSALKKTKIQSKARYAPDLNAIEGVATAKYATAIALAGGHNILLVGPKGQGKTMLAEASTKLLPKLSSEEMLEVNKIYSAKGLLKGNELIGDRPYRAISNDTSQAALLGSAGVGRTPPTPGEISLAHTGVLLFDEINMSPAAIVDALRMPLNDKEYTVTRVAGSVCFPCGFMLVAAMNPCRCGWYGHQMCPTCESIFYRPEKNRCPDHPRVILERKCYCKQREIDKFSKKISEPVRDRIDLKVMVSSFDRSQRFSFDYSTRTVRAKIRQAREMQLARYRGNEHGWTCNADIPDGSQLQGFSPQALSFAKAIIRKLRLDSFRTHKNLMLVSRTIADYEESRDVRKKDIMMGATLMGLADPFFRGFNK